MIRDPYRYFRVEARELLEGLSQGVLQLEREPVTQEPLARLLRLAHTLKGAARVVKQPAIAERAHAFEEILASQRGSSRPLPGEQGSAMLRLLDEIDVLVKALDLPKPAVAQAAAPRAPAEEPFDTIRVRIEELDRLLMGVGQTDVVLGALARQAAQAEPLRLLAANLRQQLAAAGQPGDLVSARWGASGLSAAEELEGAVDRLLRTFTSGLEQARAEIEEVRSVADRLRLVPAQTVVAALERAVRDAAQELGKSVEFESTGGDIRLDAAVLAALRDALLHVVRNAVAHGVEGESERRAARKPATGKVRLQVQRLGSQVIFACSDDGAGVDVQAVRQAAVRRGLVSAAGSAVVDARRAAALLLAGGLTTAASVTELSGRGVGLDVARETTARLGGTISLHSDPGLGTTVTIAVPFTIASLEGLVVEAGGAVAAIPLRAIRQAIRVRDSEVSRRAGTETIVHEGRVIPFLPLEQALGRPGAARRSRLVWSAALVQDGDRLAALAVDRIVGTARIVMRRLPALVEADPVVAGAALDGEGNPHLVLDPGGLLAAADRPSRARPEPPSPRPPVLVIDDSLTTRMLEKSILESAGYEVDVAVSAEAALLRARERHYGLFVVDVEMPGMDGFEFVRLTRSDGELRKVPAVLVTSRNAPADRKRGMEVGAHAYIVKSEFDQAYLLETIRAVIG
jgi:two-component system chemotaxis sensor kinase CheA